MRGGCWGYDDCPRLCSLIDGEGDHMASHPKLVNFRQVWGYSRNRPPIGPLSRPARMTCCGSQLGPKCCDAQHGLW